MGNHRDSADARIEQMYAVIRSMIKFIPDSSQREDFVYMLTCEDELIIIGVSKEIDLLENMVDYFDLSDLETSTEDAVRRLLLAFAIISAGIDPRIVKVYVSQKPRI